MQVEITPTAHSQRGGYDLMIRTHSHGWAKSDLTSTELAQIRDAISEFLSNDAPDLPEPQDASPANRGWIRDRKESR
jgi:hypothetical protein